ncbi:acyltransferase [Paenibacillus sp. DMB20]|uniref:acyltransferase n=1 Tax=Paenibacillus sp. DMB20 TaxID=1642570 RepID=UPI000627C9D3|nr:acyltransferase [Paenibacillus sp. DMB20]KKO55203.1 acyltransferase [Paenibacillus sp. DMB20]
MSKESRKTNLPEIQLVRAIAIIGVLSVHATSSATVVMKESNLYAAYNFFNIFMKIGTPVFLFLSSFVLFYSYYSRPLDKKLIGNFYKKRLKFILIPYVIFSVIYFVIVHFKYYPDRSLEESLEKFVVQLFSGKAYTHLYFIYISIQFYLLFPILLWLFKCKPNFAKWAVPAGFAMQYGFIIMNKLFLLTERPASSALHYMSYFMLGAVLGIYYPKLKEWFEIRKENVTASRLAGWIILLAVWLSASLGHVYVYHSARLYGAKYDSLLYHFLWNMQTITAGLVAILLSHLLIRHAWPWLTRSMARLGELSFGIYLIHPLFLFIYRLYPPKMGYPYLIHLWYLGGFMFALLASCVVVSLTVRWLPMSWIVFGKVPPAKRKPDIASKGEISTHTG